MQALHRYLTRTPSRLLCVALTDAVGDRWRRTSRAPRMSTPIGGCRWSGPDGAPLLLEDVLASPRVRRWPRSSTRLEPAEGHVRLDLLRAFRRFAACRAS